MASARLFPEATASADDGGGGLLWRSPIRVNDFGAASLTSPNWSGSVSPSATVPSRPRWRSSLAARAALSDEEQGWLRQTQARYFEGMPDSLPWLVDLIEALGEEA